ncbi:MAG: cytochrome P450 [Solirubrobacterales bacterium]|nr:cytochrome P450 [Solirubrobacterales bacterium]MBV9423916.1 cytochrome P450 [Solirubrobacterales bacterium]
MGLVGPAPMSFNPVRRLSGDLLAERRVEVPFPPGETRFSVRRTRGFARDPLSLLLDAYERFGPVFTMRVFHGNSVFMIGPEANHYITVSHADNFTWREGHMGDLTALLGDGLLTIDGEFHHRSRRIMLPAFHHETIAAALATMDEEIDRALEGWRDGSRIDIYHWTRRLALRIAMRALFGFNPDAAGAQVDIARNFEQGLGFWARAYWLQVLRGPGTPYAQMQKARRTLDAIIFEEIARRRRSGERGEDILSLLIDATDEDGNRLNDRQIRDEVMTLLFAGHDTTTSTVGFMFYELARHPDVAAALREEQEGVLGGERPDAALLMGGKLELLEMVQDETLRMYPPAWIGARKSIETYEFAGKTVPGGAYVNYSSWVSHRLAHVFPEPDEFRPERFAPAAKAALPKGAYVPFGAGSRICIGMRFGKLEIKAIASALLQRFEFELEPGYRLRIRQMPTIGPRHGVPLIVHRRDRAPARRAPIAA